MKKEKAKCSCGFCEPEMVMSCIEPAFCKPCSVEFVVCSCGQKFEKQKDKCPVCGKKKAK